MNIKRRLERLEERKSPMVMLVALPGEDPDSVIARWCNETGKEWPDNVLIVITNVNQSS